MKSFKISNKNQIFGIFGSSTNNEIEQKLENTVFYLKKRAEKKEKTRKIRAILSIILIALLILVPFFLFADITKLTKPFTGFVARTSETYVYQKFSDALNLQINESQSYNWQLQNQGQLVSAKISGKLILVGEGNVKIYLEDKLILDSTQLKEDQIKKINEITNVAGITGAAIEELEEINNSSNNFTNGSISEENFTEENLTEPNKLIPEPTENNSQNEENLTILEENETNITEPKEQPLEFVPEENLTENLTEKNIIIKEISFSNVCIETCDLEYLNLTSSSYTLRIEIENASLYLDTIDYTIKPIQIENITNITNRAPELLKEIPNQEILINSSKTINLLDYFSDPDNDSLTFNFTAENEALTTITIEENILKITAGAENGSQKIIVYASDGNFTAESNVFLINVTENATFECSFAEPRKGNTKLPDKWYIKQADLSNEEKLNEKALKTIFLKSDEFYKNVLLYNLSYVAETKENIEIKSNAFNVKKGRYRISFYTKPEMILKNNPENGFSLIINVFDKKGKEVETFPPLVWNNTNVWEKDPTQKRNITFENFGLWKKITIELEFPENSDKAVFAFMSDGVDDYLGQVFLCNFSLEEIK